VSVQEDASNSLGPYITSQFSDLSLSPATSQAAYITSGVIDVPLAKLIDLWGLDVGFVVMIFFNTLGPSALLGWFHFVLILAGLIMLATCKNITTYAAAQACSSFSFKMALCADSLLP
jgi:hypothetical protein